MTERRYPIRNRVTGKHSSVPLSEYGSYMSATEPATGKPLFEALSDVPGIATGLDGSQQQTLIPKENVRDALGQAGSLSILRSDDDPRWEEARRNAVSRARRQTAKDRAGSKVFMDSLLSGVTFGATSKLGNTLAGEGAEEARSMSIEEHGLAQFGGRALSLVALGMLPVPGIGAAVGASRGLRAGSFFELGAKASSVTRSAIRGEGFVSELAKRIAGPIAFGAVADIPLSAAMVAADIVDHDKELSGEAIAADFLTQYGLSVSIAAATSLPLAFLGAGLRSAGKKAVSSGDELIKAGEKDALLGGLSQKDYLSAGARGWWRYTSRKHFRGRAGGIGDSVENLGYRFWNKLTGGHTGRLASEHPVGRWMAGKDADALYNLNITNKELLDALHSSQTSAQLQKTVRAIRRNVSDPRFDEALAFIDDHAVELITGRRKAATLIQDSKAFAKTFLAQEYKHPIHAFDVAPHKKAAQMVDAALEQAGLKPLGKGAGKFPERLGKALNLRKEIRGETQLARFDKSLREAFPGLQQGKLDQITNAERAARSILQISDDIGERGTRLFDEADLLEYKGPLGTSGIRADMKSLEGSVRGLFDDKVRVLNSKSFTTGKRPVFMEAEGKLVSTIDNRFNEVEKGIAGMVKANHVVADLTYDARPFVRGSTTLTNDEILAAQVHTVMSVKQRTAETLKFIALKSGGARHTAAFGGVYLFRNMNSAAEKRAAFGLIYDTVNENAASIDVLSANVGDMVETAAASDMALGTSLAVTQMAALSYLDKQMPRPGNATIAPEEQSAAEIDNFFEAVGALLDPLSVLASAADGSVTEQGVSAIGSVYPRLYQEMVLDVAEFVQEHAHGLGHAQMIRTRRLHRIRPRILRRSHAAPQALRPNHRPSPSPRSRRRPGKPQNGHAAKRYTSTESGVDVSAPLRTN